MKLWALLEALQPLDPSADVEIEVAGERGPRTDEFEVRTMPGSLSCILMLQSEDFPLSLAVEIEGQIDDLETQLDDVDRELETLKEAAESVIKAASATEIADAIKEHGS